VFAVAVHVDDVDRQLGQVLGPAARGPQCDEQILEGALELRHQTAGHDVSLGVHPGLAGEEHRASGRHHGVREPGGPGQLRRVDALDHDCPASPAPTTVPLTSAPFMTSRFTAALLTAALLTAALLTAALLAAALLTIALIRRRR
jgi:hypothetical protein